MTYVPAGAGLGLAGVRTPTILFLEIRARPGLAWCGWWRQAGWLSPGWLHDLHHFREQMMLARMIRVIISDNSTTHIRQTDIIVETVGRPRPAKQYTAQTDRERERQKNRELSRNIRPSWLLWRAVRTMTLNVIKLENSESIFSFLDWSSDKMISCCQLTRIIF